MAESQQHKLDRVRRPRVQITYDVETNGAMQKVELPMVVGVLADLSGKPSEALKPLKERKVVNIDRDNFNDVLSRATPRAAVKVKDRLTGGDGNFLRARKLAGNGELGFVGEPEKVDLTLLNQLIGHELIPVLAPLATSRTGQTFTVNADTFAGAVAGALKAKRLLLLTDVPGVLDKSKKLIPELSVKDARKLIADGTIAGGMIPKVETCIYALEQGVQGVVIIDGKMQHAVLLELFTNAGTGTLIHK